MPPASLPEAIGGGRNWDYRYCWLRDVYFTLNAMRRQRDQLAAIAAHFKAQDEDLAEKVKGLQAELRKLQKENQRLAAKAASQIMRVLAVSNPVSISVQPSSSRSA